MVLVDTISATMRPLAEALPNVLPTERLGETGKAKPEIREQLRRIPNLRNGAAVLSVYGQSLGLLVMAVWWRNPLGYVAVFIWLGRTHAAFAALSHEAAHRLLFSKKKINDWVGRWLVGYPAFISTDLYRRGHMAHHKDEFGPNEPDMNLYVGYPISRDSMRRKLLRDTFGVSGWKNLKSIVRGVTNKDFGFHARRIVYFQVGFVLAALLLRRPEAYLLWFSSWMTEWRVINRLRAIAEHGGMERSRDRRLTTHSVRQSRLLRWWLVPYNIGWHLAHHVDMGVPWRNLPALHAELRASGWVTDSLEYPSYWALWRRLASSP